MAFRSNNEPYPTPRHPLAPLLLVCCLAMACSGAGETGSAAPPPPEGSQAPVMGRLDANAPSTGQLPPDHPPIGVPAGGTSIVPPEPGAGTGDTALAWKTPQGWVEETPSSQMRRAQYRVPGPGGDGECVVFYFGPGQGGAPMDNAMRWAGQFTGPDGQPATGSLKTSNRQVGDVDVLMVEVKGAYSGGMAMPGMAPATAPRPGQMLLGAIAEGPDANWFFKFTGPEATVSSQREAFESMVDSLKKGA